MKIKNIQILPLLVISLSQVSGNCMNFNIWSISRDFPSFLLYFKYSLMIMFCFSWMLHVSSILADISEIVQTHQYSANLCLMFLSCTPMLTLKFLIANCIGVSLMLLHLHTREVRYKQVSVFIALTLTFNSKKKFKEENSTHACLVAYPF